eukprot:scaffold8338_cov65-Phaeocystis_antarctica.AAC.1
MLSLLVAGHARGRGRATLQHARGQLRSERGPARGVARAHRALHPGRAQPRGPHIPCSCVYVCVRAGLRAYICIRRPCGASCYLIITPTRPTLRARCGRPSRPCSRCPSTTLRAAYSAGLQLTSYLVITPA